MVPEGGRLRRRSPACTSGAAAEARERRLRSGGSSAEAPLALRGFGRRSTAGAAGGLGRRSTACPAEGGSGAGAPLALRGGSGAGTPLVLRRDGSGAGTSLALRRVAQAQESRTGSGGMTQARSPACAPRAVAGRMKLACAPGAGAQEPRSCSGNCSAVAARSRQPRRERLPMSAWSALRPTRAQRGPASAAPEAAASSRPAQGVRLVTRTRPTPPPPHPAPTRRIPTAAPAPAPQSSAVPGSGGRGLRR